jgi:FRG domain-containing protein
MSNIGHWLRKSTGARLKYQGTSTLRKAEIEDIAAFVRQIENLSLVAALMLFRGQPVKGNLIPSIARRHPRKDPRPTETLLLEQLSLMGAALIQSKDPSALELLVLAQHFGLQTRLLDWTSNPLAALWFACADRSDGDVFVYAIEADNLRIPNVYEQDPFGQSKTRVFQPRLDNPRIIAQDGWFTLHRFSGKSGKFIPLEANSDVKGNLSEFRIAAKDRPEILLSLDRLGVNRRTLFPDLEGLCMHLNWKHGTDVK